MSHIGFELDSQRRVIESLPENRQLKSIKDKRTMFFELYNSYMDDSISFTKKEYGGEDNIYETFRKKISRMLPVPIPFVDNRYLSKSKKIVIDITGTHIINAFLEKEDILVVKRPLLVVAKLIRLLHCSHRPHLFFDLNSAFKNLVQKRIKKVNKNSLVLLKENSILVDHCKSNLDSTVIIPCYEHISSGNIQNIKSVQNGISEACRQINENGIKSIYLVYPKNDNFKKHIQIDLGDRVSLMSHEYKVKVIPYSFSFCTRVAKNYCSSRKNKLKGK